MAVDPSFVEKDWHATQIIAGMSTRCFARLAPVFSGRHEPVEGLRPQNALLRKPRFQAPVAGPRNRSWFTPQYRASVIDAIRANTDWALSKDGILVGDQGRFLRCDIAYSPIYAPTEPLRASIRLEMTLKAPAFPPERRPLRSLVAQVLESPPEVPEIQCVVPAETAANKLSALTWRVLSQHHGADDDPTVVRHIHDLAALEGYALDHPGFPVLLRTLFISDASRVRGALDVAALQPAERVSAVLDILQGDPKYLARYRQFVAASQLRAAASGARTPVLRGGSQPKSLHRLADASSIVDILADASSIVDILLV